MKKFFLWTRKSGLRKLIFKIIFWVTFFLLLFTFIFGIKYQTGNNMYPKIMDGDLILTYRLDKPQIDDAVLYETPDGKIKCGRIVASSGDNVQINENGELLVNGYTRSEEVFYPTKQGKIGSVKNNEDSDGYDVPKNDFFRLNDFRSDLKDSRTYGAVDAKKIKGIVIFSIRHRGF